MHLRIDNIEFKYDSENVLNRVKFSVDKGAFVGILGPNGSGKTTLLKCISRVLKPRGVILINNIEIENFSSKDLAKEIGVVPQGLNITADFTAFEIVLMGRTPYTQGLKFESSEDLAIVKSAMFATDTWHLRDRAVTELSGGEKQRVVIAKALAQRPKILLLDEPTVHLDMACQFEILDLVKNLSIKENITVVSVFHDLNLASQYSNRLILLNEGKIISIGIPEEVLTPKNIRKTYHIDVLVKKHPLTGAVYVTPYYSKKFTGKETGKTVHIVCGGGSGAQLMKLLKESGFKITTGVLNVLDTDYEVARALDISVIGEIPFSQITDEPHKANIELMKKADVVVLTDFPVGPGNLKNIEAMEIIKETGTPLILINSTEIQKRDFTNGRFSEYFTRLSRDVTMVKDTNNAVQLIQKLLKDKNALGVVAERKVNEQ